MDYELIGLGNAVFDVLMECEDSFLTENNMQKGGMQLMDEATASTLTAKMSSKNTSPGGSVANTIYGFSKLGGKAAFIGKVSDDFFGKKYINDMQEAGVDFLNAAEESTLPTAFSLIAITPDSQRTMNTYLGSAGQLEERHMHLDTLSKTRLLLIEGYLYDIENTKNNIRKACEIAKNSGAKIAFCLSDVFVIERHRKDFLHLIENYVDLVFANEHELMSLFETDSLENALENIRKISEIAVATRHEQGSIIITKDEQIDVKAVRVENVTDSTGAGDLYLSGFLYAYVNNYPLLKCGNLGSLLASEVITHIGTKPSVELTELIKKVA